jgi:hypothetical protein
MHALRAVSVHARIEAALGPGRVAAAYRRSCTLQTEAGELITLLEPELGNGPNAVLVPMGGWREGERFWPLGTDGLWFEQGPPVQWQEAARWSAADAAPRHPPRRRIAGALREALGRAEVAEGLLPVVLGQDGAAGEAAVSRQALAARASPLITALPDPEAARGLVGLGPGSTPSGDDLVAGLLLTLHYAGRPEAEPLRAVAATARTTRLASSMLRWAAQGEAREHVLLLLRSLFEEPAPRAAEPLGPVLRYGATSGADMAAGILIGLELLERR